MNIWIRLWFAALIITDRLMGTRLVEWKMARLQHRVETYEAQAAAIQQQREELKRLLHATQVELCVLYLHQRRLLRPETWLRFAPATSADDEQTLDLLIDRLVKPGLATVRTETIGEVGARSPRPYVYHLRPDWNAIADLLSARKEHLDPMTAAWLEEMRGNENGKIHH